MMKLNTEQIRVKELIDELGIKYNKLYLAGSRVYGKPRPNSDYDILILTDNITGMLQAKTELGKFDIKYFNCEDEIGYYGIYNLTVIDLVSGEVIEGNKRDEEELIEMRIRIRNKRKNINK